MIQKNIFLNNKSIGYKIAGQGLPVVLIHGFAEDHDVWRYQQDELLKHNYQLIIPDLPGSNQSSMTEDMSIEGMVHSVKEILNNESVSKCVMIGHSMGGYITLAFAEKWADQLLGFGLFHSTAFPDTEEKKATRRKSIAFMQAHGADAFIRQSTPNLFTETFRNKNNQVIEEMMARYSSFDVQALVAYYEAMIYRPERIAVLQSFSKPVLFIIGRHDKAISFEDSMKQCHLPQTANIHILDNSAHMGMWEEKEKSNQAILSYLEEVAQFTLE
ncbi:MAG: alpha/beta hydrolase [Chitinophagaceae bacterium]